MKFTAHLPDTNKLSLRGDQQTDRTASLCPKETRWNLTCWWKAKENMFWPRRMWDWEPDLMSHRVTCSPSQPTVQTQMYMIARIYSCARLLQTWIWRYNSENYSLDIVARFSTICLSVCLRGPRLQKRHNTILERWNPKELFAKLETQNWTSCTVHMCAITQYP